MPPPAITCSSAAEDDIATHNVEPAKRIVLHAFIFSLLLECPASAHAAAPAPRRQSLRRQRTASAAEDRAQLLGRQDVLHPPERALLANGERRFAHRGESQAREGA